MLPDLFLVLFVAASVGVAPGYFWSMCLVPAAGWVAGICWSAALSLALVPVVALALAKLAGTGVTLLIAVVSPLAVLGAGAAANARFGRAKDGNEPLAAPPSRMPATALALVALALGLVAASVVVDPAGFRIAGACGGWPTTACRLAGEAQRFVLPAALLVSAAGVAHLVLARRARAGTEEAAGPREAVTFPGRRLLLPAVLLLALVRGYSGPVLHDWPFVRGLDHYSHGVMTDMILARGDAGSYLIYPPGFHVFAAILSRLTGLVPLEVFPVLGPALLLLPALALYVLGDRLWGWPYGEASAFFSVLAGGTYYYSNDAMYPNLISSQFLLVLAVTALLRSYSSPSVRNGLLLAALGSAVVFYHQVASVYAALLFAAVSLVFVPYLLVRRRRTGLVLAGSLALLAALAVAYAWGTYDVGREIVDALGGSGEGGTSSGLTTVVGSSPAYGLGTMIGAILSQPVAWLGLLGAALLLADPTRRHGAPEALVRATLILWAVLLFVGSRTSLSGFPQRFGRDLGVPLALLGAMALVALVLSLFGRRDRLSVLAASLAVVLAVFLVGLRGAQSLEQAAGESRHLLMTPEIAEAGAWLAAHNGGGNIMVSPQQNQVPSRMMLAMGHYSALQSYPEAGLNDPRHMPPSGPGPLRDVLWVVYHPAGQKTRGLLEKHDVRYVVFYKKMPDRPVTPFWTIFKPRKNLYTTVFENKEILIVAPKEGF